jgi:hypothetical protein
MTDVPSLCDLRKPDIGEKIWARFSQPKEQTLWYCRSLAYRFYVKLPSQLSTELREIVAVLEAGDEGDTHPLLLRIIRAEPVAVAKHSDRTRQALEAARPKRTGTDRGPQKIRTLFLTLV